MITNRRRLLALFAGVVTTPKLAQAATDAAMSPVTAYAFSFAGLQGEPIRLLDFAGKPIVVVNTASIAALDGTPGQGPYATTKAGLIALALPLARELAGRGIRVNTVTPGGFDTPMNAWIPPEYLDSVARQILNPQRLGHADEYAEMALALIENTYANATSIRLDGGYRMS